jgi:predicted naringenin-chalcone synthase
MKTPSILALGTAVPPYVFSQEEIENKMIEVLCSNAEVTSEKKEQIRKLYQNSAIKKRYSVLPDFLKPRSEWHFWGHDYPSTVPGMSKRNEIYKKEAPKLAREAAEKALLAWGGERAQITHVISVSCTGIVAPGIEFDLVQFLNLKPSVHRFGINFMGCFGAFKGLAIAQAFAQVNPKHRVLLVCTEICSLHLQTQLDSETLTANSLFSDGAAAVIVGSDPQSQEIVLWDILNCYSFGIENSLDKMAWEASDHGFLMRLSPYVPVLIGRYVPSFINELLGSEVVPSACDWAVHPGGKSILQAVEKAAKLEKDQTQSSWNVLANYGNMSSSTFLFVLEHLYQQQTPKKWSIGLGFGPGLSVEGILLRKANAGAL